MPCSTLSWRMPRRSQIMPTWVNQIITLGRSPTPDLTTACNSNSFVHQGAARLVKLKKRWKKLTGLKMVELDPDGAVITKENRAELQAKAKKKEKAALEKEAAKHIDIVSAAT